MAIGFFIVASSFFLKGILGGIDCTQNSNGKWCALRSILIGSMCTAVRVQTAHTATRLQLADLTHRLHIAIGHMYYALGDM